MNKTYKEVGKYGSTILSSLGHRGEKEHTENLEPMTYYDWDGSILLEEWRRDGMKHRDDGPAAIWYQSGRLFPGDSRTREDMKAQDKVVVAGWFINGVEQDVC